MNEGESGRQRDQKGSKGPDLTGQLDIFRALYFERVWELLEF